MAIHHLKRCGWNVNCQIPIGQLNVNEVFAERIKDYFPKNMALFEAFVKYISGPSIFTFERNVLCKLYVHI